MIEIRERFLKYVSFDTQSSETSSESPSTRKQLLLADYLKEECEKIGLSEVTRNEYGIVQATLKGNTPCDVVIGFIAHMDTSPECSGKDIHPQIIENFDGAPIPLNEKDVLSPKDYPDLLKKVGQELITTDGTTLLGADDKAGIAIILTAMEYLLEHPEIKHGEIRIAFTPDEEVGRGTEHFDVSSFHADYAYTVDGGDIYAIEYENFNAGGVEVIVHGISIHPGDAKGKMKNASLIAMEFDQFLPSEEIPSKTEGYEGFHHLTHMEGSIEKATLSYIIRDHDKEKFHQKKEDFFHAQDLLNQKYGEGTIEVHYEEQYQNMIEILKKDPRALDRAVQAYKNLHLKQYFVPIRGGTDGARLSFLGLPTPNLGTGGANYHGRFEYVSVTEMKTMVKVLIEIARLESN